MKLEPMKFIVRWMIISDILIGLCNFTLGIGIFPRVICWFNFGAGALTIGVGFWIWRDDRRSRREAVAFREELDRLDRDMQDARDQIGVS